MGKIKNVKVLSEALEETKEYLDAIHDAIDALMERESIPEFVKGVATPRYVAETQEMLKAVERLYHKKFRWLIIPYLEESVGDDEDVSDSGSNGIQES
jgi:hypothetical protein